MGKIESFEELKVWALARELAKDIFSITQEGLLSKDFALKDQINRSSGSIMDNIAEGFERCGNKEFIQFLFIAKASAGETRSQLYRCFDRGYLGQSKLNELLGKVSDVGKQLSEFIHYLKKSQLKGETYYLGEPLEKMATTILNFES